MTGRYSLTEPNLIRMMDELGRRISKLERTPQLPNSSVDVGSISTAGPDNSSFASLSGSAIPPEITGFYNFFGRTVYVAHVWRRGTANNYIYTALTSSDTENMFLSRGALIDGTIKHLTDTVTHVIDDTTIREWFGLVGAMEIYVGSGFWPGSKLIFQGDAGLFIDGFPQARAWHKLGFYGGQASADLTLTTSPQDIVGATVSDFIIPRAATIKVTGVFDFEETVAGTTVGIGELVFDGVTQTRKARFGMAAVTDVATITQTWTVTVATGSDFVPHSFKLQGSKTINAGTQVIRAASSSITVEVYSQ